MAASSASDPASEASAKATTLIVSTATSVTARAHCICFCAIRPAKSSSKNRTACPRVQRFSRDSTSGLTFGKTMMAFDADDSPNSTGRAIRKNATEATRTAVFDPSKNASGPVATAESMTFPRI